MVRVYYRTTVQHDALKRHIEGNMALNMAANQTPVIGDEVLILRRGNPGDRSGEVSMKVIYRNWEHDILFCHLGIMPVWRSEEAFIEHLNLMFRGY